MLRALDAALSRVEEFVISVLLIAASFVLFANVVARYGFNDSFPWAEEMTRYAIVWMVFVGGGVAARKGAHIGVDVLARLLGESRAGKIVMVGVDLLCVAASVFLVVFGWELVSQAREFGQMTPALQIPLWTVQLAIPVGGALMGLRFSQRVLGELRNNAKRPEVEILS